MNTNQLNHQSKLKKRKPLLAAILSLLSLGLGQVYNGDILKGIVLNLVFWATFFWYGWYTVSAYFSLHCDLIFFLITAGGFVLLKIYSIVQAFIRSRRMGKTYQLKPINRWYVYLLFVLILLIPPIFSEQCHSKSVPARHVIPPSLQIGERQNGFSESLRPAGRAVAGGVRNQDG